MRQEDRQWFKDALHYWSNTTPDKCNCSQDVIDWNVNELTTALAAKRFPVGGVWIKGPDSQTRKEAEQ